MAAEESRQRGEEPRPQLRQLAAVAALGGEAQLEAEALLPEEGDPVGPGGVELWRGADEVVAPPAETLSRLQMLARQRLPEPRTRRAGAAREAQPFEHQIAAIPLAAAGDHGRSAHRRGGSERPETVRFRDQDLRLAGLHEPSVFTPAQTPAVAAHARAQNLPDGATAHGVALPQHLFHCG